MKRNDRWSDVAELQTELARKPPAWMRGAVLTAVGPKQVDGLPTRTPALAVMVRSKRRRSEVERTSRIPRSINGIRTDVLAARPLAPEPSALPAPRTRFGIGSALQAGNEVASLGLFANHRTQGSVLLTAGHFVAPNANVLLRRSNEVVGTCVASFTNMRGELLYPNWPSVRGRALLVDCAVVELGNSELEPDPSMPGGGELQCGLPGDWLDRAWSKRAIALVESSDGASWLRGRVTHVQPLPLVRGTALGLFLVALPTPPPDGASGTTWFIEDEGNWLALGLHWGRRLAGNAAFAIVTHAFQAYGQMGLLGLG